MATDPICGMYVDEETAELRAVRGTRTYYFCATSCLSAFTDPEREMGRLRRRLVVGWSFSAAIVVLTYLFRTGAAPYLAAVLAAVVQGYLGGPFYRGAYDALAARRGNMDLLIAIGSSAAFGYSLLGLLLPGRLPPAEYFDASSLILTLILSGSYLEARTRARASEALVRLRGLRPARATRLGAGGAEEIPADDIRRGDRLRVGPGERFPCDGTVLDGASESDESILTGESMPVPKRPGARVIAGAVNGEGLIEMRAESTGEDTFLARLGTLLTEAELGRVPLQKLADRLAAVFVPLVLGLAVASAAFWGLVGGADATVVLLIFVSVTITACPCAFGLATPAAITVGMGRAAREGILFKGRDALENAARVDRLLTDKTGTITLGRPALGHLEAVGGADPDRLLAIALALEAGSNHPIAHAIRAEATARGLRPAAVTGIRAVAGEGVGGALDGKRVEFGRAPEAGATDPRLGALFASGLTVSVLRLDGAILGLFGFEDRLAPGVPAAVAELEREGIPVALVTGDRPEVARRIAAAAGIRTWHARVSPEGKLRLLAQYAEGGHTVAFVGDGLNDAAVIAAAPAGIALGTGTEVAQEAGRILLLRPEFSGVPTALRLARRTVGKVRQNLFWALGYNAVLLPIAAGALVPWLGFRPYLVLPILGALAMGLSSTIVLGNSLSLRAGGPAPARPGAAAPANA